MLINNHREHIRKIRNDFQASQRVKDSLNNSIQALARDLYSKDTHFIFELIQNAEDNTYEAVEPSLSFRLGKFDPTGTQGADGVLIVQNNEIGFSTDNVDVICAVGKTTKSKIQGYIGEKGIGFKSVFRVTSNPHIFSNGYAFCLPEQDEETGLGYIVPQWINNVPEGIDPSQTTIILPLDKADFSYGTIEEMLRDIEPETILFLSKLKEIKVETDTGDSLTILKDDHDMPQIQIRLEGTMRGESLSKVDEFLLYGKTFNKPPEVLHEKRNGIYERDASIAFPLNENKKKTGKIFAYLPVRSDTGLPFLINADYILPSSREEILDIPWNRWLMGCIAKLLACALPQLKEKGLLTIDLLEALASRILELSEDNMFYPIVGAVRETLRTKPLLPAYDGTFIKAKEAKLARGKELVELFSPEQLGFLFGKNNLSWLDPSITERRAMADLHTYLVGRKKYQWSKDWEIEPLWDGLLVDGDTLAPKLTADFLGKQPLPWLVKFIQYVMQPKSSSALRRTPFIRLVSDKHVSLPANVEIPRTAWFAPKDDAGLDLTIFSLVHSELAANEDIRKFLENEGIREIDAVAIAEKSVLPKYKEASTCFDESTYRVDLRRIREAYGKANDAEKAQLNTSLNKRAWLACVHASGIASDIIVWKKPGAPDLFDKTADHETWFNGLGDVNAFFLHYSVIEILNGAVASLAKTTNVLTTNLSPNEYNIPLSNEYNNHKLGLKGFNPNATIVGIKSAWAEWNQDRSMVLWKTLLSDPLKIINGETQFSKNRQKLDKAPKKIEYTDVGKLCLKQSWLPDKSGKWCIPSELLLTDLPEGFETTSIAAKELAVKLGMKQPEREQALEFVTGGDPVLKMRIERFLSASDDEQEKMLKTIHLEIPPESVPSFKDGLKNFERPQRGKIENGDNESPSVSDPDRYQEKLNEQVEEGVEEHQSTPRKITFSPLRNLPSNSEARHFLYKQYCGHCQVTETTFPKASINTDGAAENYFEACSLLSYANADYLNDAGNMLCASADTMAKFKFASVTFLDSIEDAIETFKANGELAESVSIKIRLAGEECSIKWSQRHFMRLVSLYEKT